MSPDFSRVNLVIGLSERNNNNCLTICDISAPKTKQQISDCKQKFCFVPTTEKKKQASGGRGFDMNFFFS